jgi:hypothetical protein
MTRGMTSGITGPGAAGGGGSGDWVQYAEENLDVIGLYRGDAAGNIITTGRVDELVDLSTSSRNLVSVNPSVRPEIIGGYIVGERNSDNSLWAHFSDASQWQNAIMICAMKLTDALTVSPQVAIGVRKESEASGTQRMQYLMVPGSTSIAQFDPTNFSSPNPIQKDQSFAVDECFMFRVQTRAETDGGKAQTGSWSMNGRIHHLVSSTTNGPTMDGLCLSRQVATGDGAGSAVAGCAFIDLDAFATTGDNETMKHVEEVHRLMAAEFML